MSVYTVYEPPRWADDDLADTQRFRFVRDGFYVWAFLLTPLWMIRHRLWFVLMLYLVVTIGAESALRALGASIWVTALAGILISLLVGLEAGTLRRSSLERPGWRNVGDVSGDGMEAAEMRFFDAFVRQAPSPTRPSPAIGPSVPPATQISSGASGVVGLFPEPGAQR